MSYLEGSASSFLKRISGVLIWFAWVRLSFLILNASKGFQSERCCKLFGCEVPEDQFRVRGPEEGNLLPRTYAQVSMLCSEPACIGVVFRWWFRSH